MTSIRSRLTAYLVGGIGLLVVSAGVWLQISMAAWLEREFDHALEARAEALETLTKQQGGEVELDFADEFMPEFESASDSQYFELWLDGDTLLERSNSFELDRSRSSAALPRPASLSSVSRFDDIRLPDGRSGRLIRIDFVPQTEDVAGGEELGLGEEPLRDPVDIQPDSGLRTATLLVARERESLDAQIQGLRWSLLALLGVLLGTLAALVALALRTGLRPLNQLTEQVKSLDAGSLDRRVGGDAPPRELVPVIDQLNQLLDRLEGSFARERQLTNDIAHELKTPIAELRNLCEVGARWPDDPETTEHFFDDAWAIALQMERVVVHLLALTRFDEGREEIRLERISVARACDQAWRPLAAQANDRGLEFVNQVPEKAVLYTDNNKLGLILSNLLANAVAYSRPATQVAVSLERSNAAANLMVANHPADLETDDLEPMFDRFWRKDQARTDGRNAGLGLAIVRAFSNLLGYTVDARLAADGQLIITLTHPDSSAPMASDPS